MEPEQYDHAQTLSQPVTDENRRWQTYLNTLALLGLEQWLGDRLDDRTIHCHPDVTESACYLNVDDFKLCLIATEHVLDEIVTISQRVVEQTDLVVDFYVVLEVLEEQAQLIIRGILRHDQLVNYCSQINWSSSSQGYYQLPLDLFDPEINHLLFYVQFLPAISATRSSAATAAPSLVTSPLAATEPWQRSLQSTRTRLSQWLRDVFDDGWLTCDHLIHPESQVALSLRNPNVGAKRGRLIDVGMQVGAETVALLVTITPNPPTQFTVLIQLHPTGGKRYLLPDLKLTLHSKAGKLLQEVIARSQDNYIQLKPFKGEVGKRFSVEISLGDQRITEAFEF